MIYFFSDICWNFLYWFGRQIYNLSIIIRGEEYIINYYNLCQQHFHPCIGCKQEIVKPDEWDYVICVPCTRKMCLTFCVTCNRKIWTNINTHPTHLQMDYCFSCIENVSEGMKEKLNYEQFFTYNKKGNNFILTCNPK